MTDKTIWLRRDEAAGYIRSRYGLPCTSGYLAKLACRGGGPAFHRLDDRFAVYSEADLDAWAAKRLSPPLRRARDAAASGGEAA